MDSLFGIDIVVFVKTVGYLGLFFIIFAESGLFFGFFLPGDSLLFTAGFLASQGYLNLSLLMMLCVVAAITGDSVGYWTGNKFGERLFSNDDARLFKKEYMVRTHAFYELHGQKTLILARFVPIVRTFAPILAGIGKMNYGEFLLFNVMGGFLWAVGLLAFGFFLGNSIPYVDRVILPLVLVIIVVSFLPMVIHFLRRKK